MSKILPIPGAADILVDDDVYELLKDRKLYSSVKYSGHISVSVCDGQERIPIGRFIFPERKGKILRVNGRNQDFTRDNYRADACSVYVPSERIYDKPDRVGSGRSGDQILADIRASFDMNSPMQKRPAHDPLALQKARADVERVLERIK